jgi:hypothetical protein
MLNLEYFTEELKEDGFEVVVFIDANKTIEHCVHEQSHQYKYKSDNNFHIYGTIDGLIGTYIRNCGMNNIQAECHVESDAEITNTRLRGAKQMEFMLHNPGIALFIDTIGLLDFDVIF